MYRFLDYRTDAFMTRNPIVIASTATLRELDAIFAAHDFNAVPVVDAGNLVGFVTKFDFLKAFAFTTRQMVPHYDELMAMPIARVMSKDVIAVAPDAPLTRVLQQMVSLRARSFPVRDQSGKLAGIISREDIMRALGRAVQEAA
ncbi:MAG: CBS domain-containing protein [Hyphomicrobiales bacterium]|nr:MAG: CBS domain-containing protein [Hyphomicrobiales bacterium]